MFIPPVDPLKEREQGASSPSYPKRADLKVKGFVLELIAQAGEKALLPTALPTITASAIMLDFLPSFEKPKAGPFTPKKKAKARKNTLIRLVPVGLYAADQEGWINALMQFILFVPSLCEYFFFAPQSYYPFRNFMDQYRLDQEKNREVSSANSFSLIRCLAAKFTLASMVDKENFYQILFCLVNELYPRWEIYADLETALHEDRPRNLLIARKQEALPVKQFFTRPDSVCYDLDAFIEYRPDGKAAHYVAYVKASGVWYQCDDERVVAFRSNSLGLPLSRSIFLHYSQVAFTKVG